MNSDSRPSFGDARMLESLERAFASHAGADSVIDVQDLQRALGTRVEYLARRMLAELDTDGDGVIRKDEFLAGVRKIVFGTPDEKLRFAFRLHDHDGDGVIQPSELERMISLTLAESDVAVGPEHPERLAQRVFAEADTNHDGLISFEEFSAALSARPELLAHMTRTEARWIAPEAELLEEKPTPRLTRLAHVLENRWVSIAIVALFVLANAAMFASTMLRPVRRPTPELLKIGNACTACLNLDAAFIVLPVLRRLLTRARATWLGRVLPVDDAIDFHRLVGWSIVVFALGHGATYLVTYYEGTNARLRHLASKEGITGLALVAAVLVMGFFAREAIRRTRHFELFYFTHLLYIPFFLLAALHAPSMLGWGAVGLVGLVVEHVARRKRRGVATSIADARALRSGVTRLAIAKPAGFAHRAGDYLFLRLPALAKHEWHPFTISSAPEADALTLHVRSLGNWSTALHALAASGEASGVAAHVDGPYGSPSGDIFDARHAVLIGAGIGVTPFASVLESIVHRESGAGGPSKLEKVCFFWLNRDAASFEWFAELLLDLERVDRAGLLDVQIWMTGGKSGLGAAGLEVARDLMHADGGRDLVTGLRAKTHMGHPDWEASLRAIRDAHAPARVDVFFCGPSGLGRKIRPICEHLGMRFREERF